jgi:hypothetical protein
MHRSDEIPVLNAEHSLFLRDIGILNQLISRSFNWVRCHGDCGRGHSHFEGKLASVLAFSFCGQIEIVDRSPDFDSFRCRHFHKDMAYKFIARFDNTIMFSAGCEIFDRVLRQRQIYKILHFIILFR